MEVKWHPELLFEDEYIDTLFKKIYDDYLSNK